MFGSFPQDSSSVIVYRRGFLEGEYLFVTCYLILRSLCRRLRVQLSLRVRAWRCLNAWRHESNPERIFARWNHRQGNGAPTGARTQVLGFKPCAKPRIEDLRLILPEIGRQITLDLQMIQLQFDKRNASRKIALNVTAAHVQAGNSAAFALCFDYHMPALNEG